jgi:hypothetical protein
MGYYQEGLVTGPLQHPYPQTLRYVNQTMSQRRSNNLFLLSPTASLYSLRN